MKRIIVIWFTDYVILIIIHHIGKILGFLVLSYTGRQQDFEFLDDRK